MSDIDKTNAQRYALINNKTGRVERVIQWDGKTDLRRDNIDLIPSKDAAEGDRYHTGTREFEHTEESQ